MRQNLTARACLIAVIGLICLTAGSAMANSFNYTFTMKNQIQNQMWGKDVTAVCSAEISMIDINNTRTSPQQVTRLEKGQSQTVSFTTKMPGSVAVMNVRCSFRDSSGKQSGLMRSAQVPYNQTQILLMSPNPPKWDDFTIHSMKPLK